MTQATRPKVQPAFSVDSALALEVVDAILWEGLLLMLLEALLSAEMPKSRVDGTPCKVGRVADTLDEPYKTAYLRIVNTQLTDGGLSALDASIKLASAGIKIADTTLGRHRRGGCGCQKG